MANGPVGAVALVEGAEEAEDVFRTAWADGVIDPAEAGRISLILRRNVTETDQHRAELVCIVTEIRRGVFAPSAVRQRGKLAPMTASVLVIDTDADDDPLEAA